MAARCGLVATVVSATGAGAAVPDQAVDLGRRGGDVGREEVSGDDGVGLVVHAVADAPAVGAECRQAELHVEELAPAAHRLACGERAWELSRLGVSSGEEESKEQNAGSRGGGCHGHF